ncbi:MAG TPA: adenine deaminase [Bdellovibrionota bacterium]|jgi:adenine deaminase
MHSLPRLVEAALGKIPCDLLIKNVKYFDVFSCKWRSGEIGIIDGHIVGVEPGLKARKTFQGKGRKLVPGFIDAHVHIESSLMVPQDFQGSVLPRGTTTAVCDPHEITNVIGVEGLKYFLDAASGLALDLRVMLSSCVPATHMETNGGGEVRARDLVPLASHPKALGLAEMMNVPGVLHGDEVVWEKLEAFQGGNIDGHCPLLSGKELSAYAVTGVASCHESSSASEASEKLRKGISCWIREGSVAKDLEALAPLLTLATSTSMGFCTDDRNPLDIAREGHIDHLIRGSIKSGVPVEVAYRAASWSVARHYGLKRLGAIAPGYRADLVLLDDARRCSVAKVWKSGLAIEDLENANSTAHHFPNTVRASSPAAEDLRGPEGRVHVIGVKHGRILTDHLVGDSADPEVSRLSVLERYGKGSRPSNGYARGFGKLKGAIASSVGHDSHNLIVVGSDPADMKAALASLIECGGGFSVVKDGAVQARLELPFGGLMSSAGAKAIAGSLAQLHKASKSVGCILPEPFLQLAFLSLPVIPSLKLTDKGLVDVNQFRVIGVSAG